MAWLQRNPLILALAALAILLLVAIGVETGFGADLRTAIPANASKKAAPFEAKLLPSVAMVDAEQVYTETATRPLFHPTRRPAPEAAPASTFQAGQFVLLGVIAVGDNRIALLREKTSGRIHRVERGKEVSGVKVAEIERETVTLTQGSGREVLELQVQKAAGAPGTAANPAGSLPTAAAGPFGGPVASTPPAPGGAPVAMPPAANAPNVAIPGMNVPAPGTPNLGAPPLPSGNMPSTVPQAVQSTPMSPEELLARRRARRGQQAQ